MEWTILKREQFAVLGPLISGVSHRLNNILGGVYGMAGFLSSKTEDERQLRRLTVIEKGVKQAADVIDSLYHLSPARDISTETVALDAIVEKYCQNQTHCPDLQFDCAVPALVAASEESLTMLLDEAVKNAVQHGVGATQIRITVETDLPDLPAGTCVRIADDGCGCDAPIEELFMPFVTGKGPCDDAGLGLARMAGIIWCLPGGWIAARSGVGQGFEVCFGFNACRT